MEDTVASNADLRRDNCIVDLVATALRQSTLSGVTEMLRVLTRSIEADGCILWELAPGGSVDGPVAPSGHLFILAQWFTDGRSLSVHDLPVQSATGEAIRRRETIDVPDALMDPIVHRAQPFFARQNIRTFFSVPVDLAPGTRAAINLYRSVARPFAREDIAVVEQMVPLVPDLYRSISDRITRELLGQVNDLIQHEESNHGSSWAELPVPDKLCHIVATTFQSLESSLYLGDDLEGDGPFRLRASTWGRPELQKECSAGDPGLTSWVLRHKRPMRIFDLAHFDRDLEHIRAEYPDATWSHAEPIAVRAREKLGIGADRELPPLSFMAAPIMHGQTILGVLRCAIATEPPFYFSDREWKTLQLVALQIGHWWSGRLRRRSVEQENERWEHFVDKLAELNRAVSEKLGQPQPKLTSLDEQALDLLIDVVEGAELCDLRLVIPDERSLAFTTTRGQTWDDGSPRAAQVRSMRFSLEGDSLDAKALREGAPQVVNDVQSHPDYAQMFPEAEKIIVAPLGTWERPLGVLDLRSTKPRPFPRQAELIAQLLAQQIDLYHQLAITLRQARDAEAANERDRLEQIQIFQDLKHQLHSPIRMAMARVQRLIIDTPEESRHKLFPVRGLFRKIHRVAQNVRFFADLAAGNAIEPKLEMLEHKRIMPLLIEAANDTELLVRPDRQLRFDVDRKTLENSPLHEVAADYDLIEQAVSNLLDNAAKYSYANTVVRIYGGLTGKRERFHITVANTGLQIKPWEIRDVIKRGWRSERAAQVTGEGSGIGLWIVNYIMTAHGGDLVVVPTNADGATEVKLIFPRRGKK